MIRVRLALGLDEVRVTLIRIKSLDTLRAKKIFIRKAEDGPYLGFSYKTLISVPLRSGRRSQRKNIINLQI